MRRGIATGSKAERRSADAGQHSFATEGPPLRLASRMMTMFRQTPLELRRREGAPARPFITLVAFALLAIGFAGKPPQDAYDLYVVTRNADLLHLESADIRFRPDRLYQGHAPNGVVTLDGDTPTFLPFEVIAFLRLIEDEPQAHLVAVTTTGDLLQVAPGEVRFSGEVTTASLRHGSFLSTTMAPGADPPSEIIGISFTDNVEDLARFHDTHDR